jgi:mono/diheme cytochrome c family protein
MRSTSNGSRTLRVATVLGCAAGGFAMVGAAVGGEARHDTGKAAKGTVAYTRYCVSCHGPAGRGDGPLARDLSTPVPDLTTLAARSGGTFPYDRVVKVVTHGETLKGHGSPDMPAWGDVFKNTEGTHAPTVEAAIENLVHYVWSLQRIPG